jgi:hypothetical protein
MRQQNSSIRGETRKAGKRIENGREGRKGRGKCPLGRKKRESVKERSSENFKGSEESREKEI